METKWWCHPKPSSPHKWDLTPEVDYSVLLPLNLSNQMARLIMLEPSSLPQENLWQPHHHLWVWLLNNSSHRCQAQSDRFLILLRTISRHLLQIRVVLCTKISDKIWAKKSVWIKFKLWTITANGVPEFKITYSRVRLETIQPKMLQLLSK